MTRVKSPFYESELCAMSYLVNHRLTNVGCVMHSTPACRKIFSIFENNLFSSQYAEHLSYRWVNLRVYNNKQALVLRPHSKTKGETEPISILPILPCGNSTKQRKKEIINTVGFFFVVSGKPKHRIKSYFQSAPAALTSRR